jgi:hypothetical protein
MARISILRGVAEDERLYWMAATRSQAHLGDRTSRTFLGLKSIVPVGRWNVSHRRNLGSIMLGPRIVRKN